MSLKRAAGNTIESPPAIKRQLCPYLDTINRYRAYISVVMLSSLYILEIFSLIID